MTHPQRTGVIDAWMQHPNERFFAQPFLESLRRWARVDAFPVIPIEATVAAMDMAGVELGLLSAWWGPRGELIGNDEVAAHVQAFPDRFRGVASVDISRPMDAVRELRRCVREHGFIGLRVIPWLWDLPPDDRRYYPLYAECVELGVPFCTQVGHTGPLMSSEPGRPIPYLERVALDFGELTIVAGHIGAPWVNEMISVVTKCPNVFIDTSAYKTTRYPADFVEFMRGRGRKRVLFGTNFPMLTPGACLEGLDGLGLDEEATRLFLRDNALRVFGLGA